MKHHAERHFHKVVTWKLLSAEETERAILSEERNYNMIASYNLRKESYLSPSDLIVWSCVHCRDLPSERDVELLEITREHIREAYVDLMFPLCLRSYRCYILLGTEFLSPSSTWITIKDLPHRRFIRTMRTSSTEGSY